MYEYDLIHNHNVAKPLPYRLVNKKIIYIVNLAITFCTALQVFIIFR